MYLVPHLMTHPIITYQDAKKAIEVTYPTARADIDALISMKILRQAQSRKKPKLFIAHEIFQLAYFDDLPDWLFKDGVDRIGSTPPALLKWRRKA